MKGHRGRLVYRGSFNSSPEGSKALKPWEQPCLTSSSADSGCSSILQLPRSFLDLPNQWAVGHPCASKSS